MPVEKCQGVDILFGRYIKGCIKGRIETLHHPLLLALILVMGLQEEGTERRTEGQCVDRRNGNGYDQGHTELFVENTGDRKSTRLNSSHVAISYAVFCLKKKKKINKHIINNNH